VKRGDYEALADRAFRLLEDPELAGRIIARARNECRKYGWEAVREQWLEVYQELVTGQPARNRATTAVSATTRCSIEHDPRTHTK
jgi:hypothetical protein